MHGFLLFCIVKMIFFSYLHKTYPFLKPLKLVPDENTEQTQSQCAFRVLGCSLTKTPRLQYASVLVKHAFHAISKHFR